jgi:hypothetical protein
VRGGVVAEAPVLPQEPLMGGCERIGLGWFGLIWVFRGLDARGR